MFQFNLRGVESLDEHVTFVGAVRAGQPAVVGVTHSLLRAVLVVSLRQPPVLQALAALACTG